MKFCFVFFFAIFILNFSFNYGAKFVNSQSVPEEYVVISQQIRSDVAAKLVKRYNMKVIGITGGLADCVNVLGLSFQIRGPLTKERLREILVDCVEELLAPINANERLRPFLKNYPFTAEGIDIEIFVVDNTGVKVYHPEIMLAAAYEGILKYRTFDKHAEFGYQSTTVEDYATALKIVKKQ